MMTRRPLPSPPEPPAASAIQGTAPAGSTAAGAGGAADAAGNGIPASGATSPSGPGVGVSLLWPAGRTPSPGRPRLSWDTSGDLDLPDVIRALTNGDRSREALAAGLLCELCTDLEVIRYRQETLADLLDDSRLRAELHDLAPGLALLGQGPGPRTRHAWSITHIAFRLEQLERYVEIALRLRQVLADAPVRATSLLALRAHLDAVTAAPQFEALHAELPGLRAVLARVGSITIGINLTRDLLPEGATILSVSAEKVAGRAPLLERLLGRGSAGRALGPLFDVDVANAENPLFRDLRKLLEAVVAPVADALGRYAEVNVAGLSALEPEIVFLLNAVAVVQRLEGAGLPVCRPEIAPLNERVTILEDGYNVSLALRVIGGQAPAADVPGGVVTNAMTFDDTQGRVWILTGPNRGGKTTYTRAVGLSQLLFQAGLHVPARAARLSPADAIFTHFPVAEGAGRGHGRLDEEASRLGQIFQEATPHSVILLNEVLAGTSAIEALGLAFDAVRGLRLLGARAIYTTHLHELAARVDEVNGGTPGEALVASLVADVAGPAEGEPAVSGPTENGPTESGPTKTGPTAGVIGPRHKRTFRILPGPPRNVSYASEIAEQHGISYPQLQRLLQQRGVLASAPVPPASVVPG